MEYRDPGDAGGPAAALRTGAGRRLSAAARGRRNQVWSSSFAPLALFMTERMPELQPEAEAYIWLRPMTSPLVAVSVKQGLPFLPQMNNFHPKKRLLSLY